MFISNESLSFYAGALLGAGLSIFFDLDWSVLIIWPIVWFAGHWLIYFLPVVFSNKKPKRSK